jgi:hypothetical protein
MHESQFGTPWDRMQREKASSWDLGDRELVAPHALAAWAIVEPTNTTRPAIAMVCVTPVIFIVALQALPRRALQPSLCWS